MKSNLVMINQSLLNEVASLVAEVEVLLLSVNLASQNAEYLDSSESIEHFNKADVMTRSYVRMMEITQVLEKVLNDIYRSDLEFNGYVDSLIEATDELKVAIAIQFKSSNLFH